MTPTERAALIGYYIGRGERLDPTQLRDQLELTLTWSATRYLMKISRVLPVVPLLDGTWADMELVLPDEIADED